MTADRISLLLDAETGRLERMLPEFRWALPKFTRLHTGRLAYTALEKGDGGRVARDRGRLLLQFVALADEPDSAILRFADRFGPLYLCPHNEPAVAPCWHARFNKTLGVHFCPPEGWPDRCSESLEGWRKWARLMAALLRIANSLHGRQPGTADDWATVFPKGEVHNWIKKFDNYLDHWTLLAGVINQQIEYGGLRPFCAINYRGRTEVLFSSLSPYGALFGALTTQTLLAITRARNLLTCSSCGVLFFAKRLPTRGEHSYCRKCGTKGAWVSASRDYRRAKRKARELHEKGLSLEEIAGELQRDVTRVRGWLGLQEKLDGHETRT
jgi:hypothetical protein